MAAVAPNVQNAHIFGQKPDGKTNNNCKQQEEWVKIPDVEEPYVQEVASFAVKEYDLEHKQNLKYNKTVCGWYMEIKDENLEFRLHILVKDCLGRELKYEAIVLEQNERGGKLRTLISFKRLPN